MSGSIELVKYEYAFKTWKCSVYV